MPIKGEQGYTYKALINGEWQDITIAESPFELVERFEQDEEWAKVVRCKDCKWQMTTYCPMPTWEQKDSHYCYKGERKGESE